MSVKYDLTGRTFNYWYVNKEIGRNDWHELLWDCTCVLCGKNYIVNGNALVHGRSRMCRSCSSKRHPENREKATQASVKSGLSQTKLYQCLANMHRRCEDQTNKSYCAYGARGIKVCQEWSMDNVQNFYDWAMANGYEQGLQIDRIDVNGDYEPSNCRWVTHKINVRNTRRNRIVNVFGETMTLAEAVEKFSKYSYPFVLNRIQKYGYSVEDALTKPKRHNARIE